MKLAHAGKLANELADRGEIHCESEVQFLSPVILLYLWYKRTLILVVYHKFYTVVCEGHAVYKIDTRKNFIG